MPSVAPSNCSVAFPFARARCRKYSHMMLVERSRSMASSCRHGREIAFVRSLLALSFLFAGAVGISHSSPQNAPVYETASAADPQQNLKRLSLEELGNVEVR